MTEKTAPRQDTKQSQNNLLGIGFIMAAGLSMTLSFLVIKTASQSVGSFETLFFRSIISMLIVLVMSRQQGLTILHTEQPGKLLFRTLMISISMVTMYLALKELPLVQVMSIQFSRPIYVLVLAALFLGEKVRLPRSVATFVGFIGVLIILRPGDDMHPAMLMMVGGVMCSAIVPILTRKLTKTDKTSTLMIYGSIGPLLISLIPTYYYWVTPDIPTLAMLIFLGFSSAMTQYCIVRAFTYGEASVVSPFDYTRLIFVTAAGYIVFAEIPDQYTIIGTIIICGSSLFIAWRQAIKQRRSTSVPPDEQVNKS